MHHFEAHELADSWELRAGLLDADPADASISACLRECAAALRAAIVTDVQPKGTAISLAFSKGGEAFDYDASDEATKGDAVAVGAKDRSIAGVTLRRHPDGSFDAETSDRVMYVDPREDAEDNFAGELVSVLNALWDAAGAAQAPAPAPLDADYVRRSTENWADDCVRAGLVLTTGTAHKVMTDAINALAAPSPAVAHEPVHAVAHQENGGWTVRIGDFAIARWCYRGERADDEALTLANRVNQAIDGKKVAAFGCRKEADSGGRTVKCWTGWCGSPSCPVSFAKPDGAVSHVPVQGSQP